MRVVAGISRRGSCRNAFKEHGIMTFPSFYIYDTITYARFHCANVVDGAAIHDHNTRARVDLRQTQHRSALAGGLSQNSDASNLNSLAVQYRFPPYHRMYRPVDDSDLSDVYHFHPTE
ncbi:hypothetical protein J6590_079782 [Homalodisca vitripennis]|nr:hypothetical protein J6590_079782 [Homalodisca vitripennis]